MAVEDTNPLYGGFTFAGGYSRPYVNGKATGTATTDNYVADFLWGASSAYSLSSYFVAHLRNQSHFAYVQDDWKVSPRLTLNLGVRYEYTTPYYEQKNQQSNFNPNYNSAAFATNPLSAFTTPVLRQQVHLSAPTTTTPRPASASPTPSMTRPPSAAATASATRTTTAPAPATSSPSTRRRPSSSPSPQAPQTRRSSPPARLPPPTFPSTRAFPPAPSPSIPSPTTSPTSIPIVTATVTFRTTTSTCSAPSPRTPCSISPTSAITARSFCNSRTTTRSDPSLPLTNGLFSRPNPAFGDITIALHEAYSHYDSLQVRYEQRFVGGLTLLNSFTWAHALDNAGASLEANTPSPQDYRNLAADYGQSEYNQPVINTTSLIYDLPFGRGRRYMDTGGILNAVAGDWQVSAVNQAQAGFPYQVLYNPPTANQVSGIAATYRGSNEYRPNRVVGVPLNNLNKASSTGSSIQYVNVNTAANSTGGAISIPTLTSGQSPFGNISRDPGRGPEYNNLNIAFNKRFDTPVDTLKVEFRGELYNAFNHTNFNTPATTFANSTAKTSAGLTVPIQTGGAITSTFDPRIVQFGLKALF